MGRTEHGTHTAEAVVVRTDSAAPPGHTTVVRLLALLPAHWQCTPLIDADSVTLRVRLGRDVSAMQVRLAVELVLATPELCGWEAAGTEREPVIRSSRAPVR